MTQTTEETSDPLAENRVVLTGKVSSPGELRELPSKDTVVVFRVVVPRPQAKAGAKRGGGFDTLDCAVWSGRAKRVALGLAQGDRVTVTGAVRRRFFRVGSATASRVEVEVEGLRVHARAVTRRAASS